MTENKRFTWVKNTHNKYGTIIDHQTGKDVMGTKETCYFMNKLNEENVKLKQELRKQSKKCTQNIMAIKEENEQLKERIKTLKDTIDGLTGTIAHFDMEEILNE